MITIPKPTLKQVASYTLLPGIGPRLAGLMPRFGMFAYFMALIFEAVRLLPAGHPYLRPSKMGEYRIRDVMAAAANNLGGGIRNTDQYIIFFAFGVGIILFAIQFILLASLIFVNAAEAGGLPFVNMFITVNPQLDIAHLMMDKVFGIPRFFNSCYDPNAPGAGGAMCVGFLPALEFPTQFQRGMQALFYFYSHGMLAVGGFMVVYYIFAMLAETVNTGRPFGKRYQEFYTPIRLVLAILLMLPLAYGYNTGQYIVLWAAKWGSGMATNSWLMFNNRLGTSNPLGLEPRQLVGSPRIQDIESIINFFYVVHSCRAAYEIAYAQPIRAYMVRPAGAAQPPAAIPLGGSFAAARDFFGQGDINVVFGAQDATRFAKHPANVKPYCGNVSIPSLSKRVIGIDAIYEVYFRTIVQLWNNQDATNYGHRMACNLRFADKDGCDAVPGTGAPWDAPVTSTPGPNFYMTVRLDAQALYNAQMGAAINQIRNTENPETIMDARTLLFGWGGAGMWFNKLTSFNGAMVDAMMILPSPTQYPLIMEAVRNMKKGMEKNTDSRERFSLTTSTGKSISLDRQIDGADLDTPAVDAEIAKLLSDVFKHVEDSEVTNKPRTGVSENVIRSYLSLMFAQSGLFDFRGNGEVFPLAKLAMFGRELIDKTVIMFAAGGVMIGLGGVAGLAAAPMGDLIGVMGKSVLSFGLMGITIGVLLFYVVPLLPFLYFFFAVGRWVKSIFEAMVAIPLWALAHLRLGGEGIPGSAAANGYFLILEILLRPILTLFGLLAAVAIYVAMAVGIDSVFNLVVMNVGGFDMTTLTAGGVDDFANSARDGIDALFYTAIYAVLMYMMATTSFKLIDLIPNAVMRWAGTNASGFTDKEDVYNSLDRFFTKEVQEAAGDIRRLASRTGKTVSSSAQSAQSFTEISQTRANLGIGQKPS